MTDWKGNEVQKGDTIVMVSTKPLYKDVGYFMPMEDNKYEIIENKTEEDSNYWEPTGEYIVSNVSPIILTDPVKHDGRNRTPTKENLRIF